MVVLCVRVCSPARRHLLGCCPVSPLRCAAPKSRKCCPGAGLGTAVPSMRHLHRSSFTAGFAARAPHHPPHCLAFLLTLPAPHLPHAPPQGAAKKTLSGAVSFLRELGHTASNLYHKRTDDEEEDAEYLKVGRRGGGGWGGGAAVAAPDWRGEGAPGSQPVSLRLAGGQTPATLVSWCCAPQVSCLQGCPKPRPAPRPARPAAAGARLRV